MAYQIELHPLAEVELWEAIDWYDAQSLNLGKAFAKAVQYTVLTLSVNPKRFPFVSHNKQKAPVAGFPYIVIYEKQGETVTILSIFHTSRDPQNWEAR